MYCLHATDSGQNLGILYGPPSPSEVISSKSKAEVNPEHGQDGPQNKRIFEN